MVLFLGRSLTNVTSFCVQGWSGCLWVLCPWSAASIPLVAVLSFHSCASANYSSLCLSDPHLVRFTKQLGAFSGNSPLLPVATLSRQILAQVSHDTHRDLVCIQLLWSCTRCQAIPTHYTHTISLFSPNYYRIALSNMQFPSVFWEIGKYCQSYR